MGQSQGLSFDFILMSTPGGRCKDIPRFSAEDTESQRTWLKQVILNWQKILCIAKNIAKKGNAKECSNYCTIALISHASKVMLKILQASLQQYVNHEIPDVQAGFRKGRGNRDQIANIHWIIKKQESSRKISISALLTMAKPLTVWITITCGKILKRWEYPTT